MKVYLIFHELVFEVCHQYIWFFHRFHRFIGFDWDAMIFNSLKLLKGRVFVQYSIGWFYFSIQNPKMKDYSSFSNTILDCSYWQIAIAEIIFLMYVTLFYFSSSWALVQANLQTVIKALSFADYYVNVDW